MATAYPSWFPSVLNRLEKHKIRITALETMMALSHLGSEVNMFNREILK